MKTIVVKVGSSTVADDHLRLRRRLLAGLVADIAELVHGGRRVVLVSSGAIACGQHVLGVMERPRQVPALQAASAVGQGRLFAHYERLFGDHELTAAQVLLTSEDFNRRDSYVNARNTLRRLLAWDVVPVVNENDTTATDEIRFGDNDVLAAQVAIMLRADLLVLLTDQEGLYTADPRSDSGAELVRKVTDPAQLAALEVGDASRRGAGRHARQDRRGAHGRGGRRAHGHRQRIAARRARRGGRGARRSARTSSPAPRAPRPSSCGCVTPNRCVVRLRSTQGRLAPWRRGGAACFRSGSRRSTARSRPATPWPSSAPDGGEVARGLTTMSARDLRRVRGLRSDELRALSPHLDDEVVHRDRLVLVREEAG